MELIGDAEPLQPDEEPPPVRERDADGLWADGLALSSFGLALTSAIGPAGLMYLMAYRSDVIFDGGSDPSWLDILPFVTPNLALCAIALLLGLLAMRRTSETSPRWARACSRGGVVAAAGVLCALIVVGAVYVLDEPDTQEFDEFGVPVEQPF